MSLIFFQILFNELKKYSVYLLGEGCTMSLSLEGDKNPFNIFNDFFQLLILFLKEYYSTLNNTVQQENIALIFPMLNKSISVV